MKRRIVLGTFALSSGYYEEYYLKASRLRGLLAADFAAAFRRCDKKLDSVVILDGQVGNQCPIR